MDATLPPAGWHRDPMDPLAMRWWDGAVWTGHVQPGIHEPAPFAPVAPAPAPVQPAPVHPLPVHPLPVAFAPTAPVDAAPAYVPMSGYRSTMIHAEIVEVPKKGRAGRVANERALRRNNGYGYAGLALALFGFIFGLLGPIGVVIPNVLAIVFSSIGLHRAAQLKQAGVPVTGW